jgi:hypothetical protein
MANLFYVNLLELSIFHVPTAIFMRIFCCIAPTLSARAYRPRAGRCTKK